MYVAEPYERWHEPDSPACRARVAAATMDAAELAVVTSSADKQGLAIVGVTPRYLQTEGYGPRRLVVPRWILAVYRAFSPQLETNYAQQRTQAWRVEVHELDAAPHFVERKVRNFEELLDAIGKEEDLKRAIVAADVLDTEGSAGGAVAMLVEDWFADLAGRTKGRAG